MKGAQEIFEEKLSFYYDMIDKSNYYGCTRLAHELLITFIMAEYDDGVFINEVLEDVFLNLDEIQRYMKNKAPKTDSKISDEEAYLNKDIKNLLIKISLVYKENDKVELYNALKELRLYTTNLQLITWRAPPKAKPSAPTFPVPTPEQLEMFKNIIIKQM